VTIANHDVTIANHDVTIANHDVTIASHDVTFEGKWPKMALLRPKFLKMSK
jgi:hypothetical protein